LVKLSVLTQDADSHVDTARGTLVSFPVFTMRTNSIRKEDDMSNDATAVKGFEAKSLAISLTVKDLQKSFTWYTEFLGFRVDRKLERDGTLRGYALRAGEVTISLNQDDGAKGWDRIKALGFSLRFQTDQNVDDLAKRIKSHGGTLDLEPTDMPWGARAIRLTDPDGFKLSISQPLKK
jgi:uncharacterized glyoxalase superfamily protein PhnB